MSQKVSDIKMEEISRDKKKDQVEDPKRELNDKVTNYITNEYLKSEETISRFIRLITTSFDDMITSYIREKDLKENSIVFVYKGGNILRILYNTFNNDLPNSAREIVDLKYKDFFKRSDADFSIYINPSIKDYDVVLEDITEKAYFTLDKIRNTFKEEGDFFDIYKDKENQKEIFKNLMTAVNETDTMKSNPKFKGKEIVAGVFNKKLISNNRIDENISDVKDDMYIYQENDDIITKNMIVDNNTPFYISINKAINISLLKGKKIIFRLVRMKVNHAFLLNDMKKLNLSGELIDVSIPTRDSEGIVEFFEKIEDNLGKYRYVRNIDKIFKFQGISSDYVIHDLEFILFHVAKLPWEDNKYEKRMRRLLYFYLMDLMSTKKAATLFNIGRVEVVSNIQTFKSLLGKLDDYDYLGSLISKYSSYHIKELFVQIRRIMKDVGNNREEFNSFIKVIKDNIEVFIQVIEEYQKEQEEKKGKIGYYPFTQFTGGKSLGHYEKKYLKYKTKYLNLKNK